MGGEKARANLRSETSYLERYNHDQRRTRKDVADMQEPMIKPARMKALREN